MNHSVKLGNEEWSDTKWNKNQFYDPCLSFFLLRQILLTQSQCSAESEFSIRTHGYVHITHAGMTN